MGVLKHFILPLLTVVHGYQAYVIMVQGKESIPSLYNWPDSTIPLSPREMHLMGMILSISVTLMVNNVVGIFMENSHYRGMVILLEVLYFSLEAYDAYQTNYPVKVKLYFAFLSAFGLMIHSMEPGLFTKDKNSSSTTTTTKKAK